MLERFASFIDAHQRFLLTTHENPDGDGIGASVGLAAYLRSLGKEARMVVTPSIPENLRWLDEAGLAEAYEPEGRHKDLAAWPVGRTTPDRFAGPRRRPGPAWTTT